MVYHFGEVVEVDGQCFGSVAGCHCERNEVGSRDQVTELERISIEEEVCSSVASKTKWLEWAPAKNRKVRGETGGGSMVVGLRQGGVFSRLTDRPALGKSLRRWRGGDTREAITEYLLSVKVFGRIGKTCTTEPSRHNESMLVLYIVLANRMVWCKLIQSPKLCNKYTLVYSLGIRV